jgi:hypothetical protein
MFTCHGSGHDLNLTNDECSRDKTFFLSIAILSSHCLFFIRYIARRLELRPVLYYAVIETWYF